MKRILAILAVWLVPAMLLAQIGILPVRTVENVSDGVIVTYQFTDPVIRSNVLIPETSFWQYAGFGMNDVSGEPAIPFRTDMFVIPAGYTAEVNVVDTAYRDTSFVLSPAIPNILENDTLIVIDSISPYSGFYPSTVIECDSLQGYRGLGLQKVTIIPTQYNNSTHIVRAYSMIKYKITYVPLEGEGESGNSYSNISSLEYDFLSNITLNNDYNRPNRINVQDSLWHSSLMNRSLLIVTVNEYLDSIQDFVEWKRLKGNHVYITAQNRGSWTAIAVIDSISSYYQQYGMQNLLIIGGMADVPGIKIGNNNEGVTDYYYGLPDTTIGLPQIHRGRIPADSSTEVKRVLNKICRYEKSPIRDEDFYRNALHCAHFQHYGEGYEARAFTLGSEIIRYHLTTNIGKNVHRVYYAGPNVTPAYWNRTTYSDGQPIPEDIRPTIFSWDGDEEAIRTKIDEGVFYVLHRDHGLVKGWEHPCFRDTSVVKLQNGEKLPVVFSINCQTGSYQFQGDCFAEAFLKHPAGGCVAIYGATSRSYSGYNDAMALGMFDAIWPELNPIYTLNGYNSYTQNSHPMYELGCILDQGLFRMSETWGLHNNIAEKTLLTWKLFHCFGDPTLQIYTETPQNFDEPSIFLRNDSIFVFVEDGDCRITFYDRVTKDMKAYNGNYAVYANASDSIVVCLDRHNYVPYVWDFSSPVYIQNETIDNETRYYKGGSINIGYRVTGMKPMGNVNIQNSTIDIEGNILKIDSGTYIDSNFNFHNR